MDNTDEGVVGFWYSLISDVGAPSFREAKGWGQRCFKDRGLGGSLTPPFSKRRKRMGHPAPGVFLEFLR
jgi:hypothetical protein